MIKSFFDKKTETLFTGASIKGFSGEIQRRALKKLLLLDNAAGIDDLRIPPGNRLEKKTGRWKEYWTIRVNDQYRIMFRWENGNAHDVYFGDYHDWL